MERRKKEYLAEILKIISEVMRDNRDYIETRF